jgi:acetyl-CoA acetyltransferase
MHPKPFTLCRQGVIRFIIPILTNRETKAKPLHTFVVDRNECSRARPTAQGVTSLKPAFREYVGNSSQLSNGASVSPLMSRQKAQQQGVTPLGYFRGFVYAGCKPDETGIDNERYNVSGGSIAIGHPFGMTGARMWAKYCGN